MGLEYQGQPATKCWCGNTGLVAYSPDYLRCPACETLVIARMPDPDWLIAPGERGFYGREYYEKHLIEQFGLPSLPERARADLPERCLYWLRTLLRYRMPPGKVLELGSAHGGFVALLRWAGFDAIGLEVSPWLVEFARRTFDVPMLLGAIEEQDLEPASFDVIAAMDVVEHLPDPVRSLKRCAELLKPDGLLLIQTPRFPEGKAHTQLVEENAPFLSMMLPPQHLFLFSRRSLTRLLAELGLGYVQFEPNLFPYDMFLLAGRHPLARYPWEHVTRRLENAPHERLIRGLFDLDDQLQDLRKLYAEAEADRAARLEVIERQGSQLGELEQARSQLQQLLQQTQLRQAATESEREALRQALEQVQAELQASRQAQAELNRQMAELHQRLGAAEADRAARLELIQRQDRQLGEQENELNTVRSELQNAHIELDAVHARLSDLEAKLAAAQAAQRWALEARQQLCHVLQRLNRSYVYRAMRAASLWKWLADGIALAQGSNCTESSPRVSQESGR